MLLGLASSALVRCKRNHSRAIDATASRAFGSSNRCEAPGTLRSSLVHTISSNAAIQLHDMFVVAADDEQRRLADAGQRRLAVLRPSVARRIRGCAWMIPGVSLREARHVVGASSFIGDNSDRRFNLSLHAPGLNRRFW